MFMHLPCGRHKVWQTIVAAQYYFALSVAGLSGLRRTDFAALQKHSPCARFATLASWNHFLRKLTLATPPTTRAAPTICSSDIDSLNTSQPRNRVITGPRVDTSAT